MNKIMMRKHSSLLLIPALLISVVGLAIMLLNIQLSNFQRTYFQEVEEETKGNNYYLARTFRNLLESGQLDKMRRILNRKSKDYPNPMVVKLIKKGTGAILESENVPPQLAAHVREPQIRKLFKNYGNERVLVKYDENLRAFMIYHSTRFMVGNQEYMLVMASKCTSMTLLMNQTLHAVWLLTLLGIFTTVVLIIYYFILFRNPLNRLLASTSRIVAGELEYPIFIPKHSLIREIALGLRALTEQLKKQILSLQDDAREQEAVMNALTEAMLLVGPDDRVIRWNRSAEKMFYPEGLDKISSSMECPEEIKQCIRKIENNALYSEKLVLTRGKQDLYLLVNAVSVTREECCYTLISATDITELSKLDAAHREFIAAISHEMKTPLTGIVGAIEAINNGALEHEEYKVRCIATLRTQSERLHSLLLNFLTLTSLENDNFGMEKVFLPIQGATLLRGAADVCMQTAENAGIKLLLTLQEKLEVFGDYQLLQQGLSNLIQNAIMHSGTDRIELSVRKNDEYADFCVKDYGCGIAPEHQKQIFKRFYRISSEKKKVQGSGIGLAIVKHVALYHGGKADIISKTGKGAEFHILIPLSNENPPF